MVPFRNQQYPLYNPSMSAFLTVSFLKAWLLRVSLAFGLKILFGLNIPALNSQLGPFPADSALAAVFETAFSKIPGKLLHCEQLLLTRLSFTAQLPNNAIYCTRKITAADVGGLALAS